MNSPHYFDHIPKSDPDWKKKREERKHKNIAWQKRHNKTAKVEEGKV